MSRIAIYLSNLWTPIRSSRPEGYMISLHELRAGQSVDKLFASAPLRLPDLVRGLVDSLWLRAHVECTTEVCPLSAEDADLDRNLIIVGSSARNSVRARYVQAAVPTAIITGEDTDPGTSYRETTITIFRSGSRGEVKLADANLAIVEKCRDPERGTVLFFCLGPRADSSWGATEYLVRNWQRLSREFRDRDFVICLGFPNSEKYMEEYKEPLRLSVGSGS